MKRFVLYKKITLKLSTALIKRGVFGSRLLFLLHLPFVALLLLQNWLCTILIENMW